METSFTTPQASCPEPDGWRRIETIAIQPRASEAWTRFARQLCLAIAALEEDEYLIVSIKRSNYFVQFAAQGAFGMRIEAASNFYLPQEQCLDDARHASMLEMGWNAPTNLPDELEFGGHSPDGAPNYFLDAAAPVPFELLASLAVDTLMGVFRASHPAELEYHAFAEGGDSIRFPMLGIRRGAPT